MNLHQIIRTGTELSINVMHLNKTDWIDLLNKVHEGEYHYSLEKGGVKQYLSVLPNRWNKWEYNPRNTKTGEDVHVYPIKCIY